MVMPQSIRFLVFLTANLVTTSFVVMADVSKLGRLLFFDPNLSEPAGQSCASCHDPARAFSDPDKKQPTSKGAYPERFGNRNTPTTMYMAYSPSFYFDNVEQHYVGGQFWDGRAATLEQQAKGPFLNLVEMANPDSSSVVQKVRAASYANQFNSVYGKSALDNAKQGFEYIVAAIAAFERSTELQPFSSKYDAWLAGKAQLTQQELRGLKLYEDEKKGNCAACHPSKRGSNGEPPLFTDFTYDNLGIPRHPQNPFYIQAKIHNPEGQIFVDKGLGGFVNKSSENGKFKVPTLRNIALTSPYMHNGYFKTLLGIMMFYNNRDVWPGCKDELTEDQALEQNCWPVPEVTENVNKDELGNLQLTDEEMADIVAFMETLTDYR